MRALAIVFSVNPNKERELSAPFISLLLSHCAVPYSSVRFKLIKAKLKKKSSPSITLAPSQVLKSPTGPVAATLENAEHFRLHGRFSWATLFWTVLVLGVFLWLPGG